MSNTTKPEQTDQTPEAGNNDKKTTALYDRFVDLTREAFEVGHEKSHEAWEKAMEVSRQKLTAAGEFSTEQGEAFKRFLRRDFEQTGIEMQRLGKEAKDVLNPARLGAGALSTLAKILHAAGETLTALSAKAENILEYQSGEVTMAGSLTCLGCGHKIQLTSTSVVPVCPNCQGTRFRKGF